MLDAKYLLTRCQRHHPTTANDNGTIRTMRMAGTANWLSNKHWASRLNMNAAALLANNSVHPSPGTQVDEKVHASRDRNPYPCEMREHVIAIWQSGDGVNGGFEALQTPALELLWHQHKFPNLNTCKRWIQLLQEEGHLCPKISSGKNCSEREIHG